MQFGKKTHEYVFQRLSKYSFGKLTSACFSNCTRNHAITYIHDKVMQNCVIRLRHVQTNLFTCDCQYFHNEKIFVRTTEVKQCVLITKIVALYFPFWHCISSNYTALSQSELRTFFIYIINQYKI